MNGFGARIVILFALVASFPVVLTALVWFGVSQWGAAEASTEAEMARVQLRELNAQRAAAVQRLCRDDLAVDTLLDERGRDAPPSLDYERLFRGSMDAAGLQALWVLDSLSGEVLATGHRNRILGNEGAELTRQARSAVERPFVLLLGAQEHQRFLVSACSIARGGARLTLVGGHRFSELRSLDPRQLVFTGQAGRGDELVAELMDADGVTQSVLVWRPKLDRRDPPLLLWIACVALLALGLALLFGGYLNRWLQSSVDALTEVRISHALERLAAGRTTIAIAHRLSTAARADRVLVLEDGRLVEDGTHADLVAAGGPYSLLYDAWLSATTA